MIWVQKEFNYAAKVDEITEWLQGLPGKVVFPPSMLLIVVPPNVIKILVVVAYEEGSAPYAVFSKEIIERATISEEEYAKKLAEGWTEVWPDVIAKPLEDS